MSTDVAVLPAEDFITRLVLKSIHDRTMYYDILMNGKKHTEMKFFKKNGLVLYTAWHLSGIVRTLKIQKEEAEASPISRLRYLSPLANGSNLVDIWRLLQVLG